MAVCKDSRQLNAALRLVSAGCLSLITAACSSEPLYDTLPGDIGFAEDSGVRLLWINSTADCLDCQNLDYRLRRLQARWKPDLKLTLVHVGSPDDETIAAAFLRKHRLAGSVVSVAGGTMSRYEPAVVTPALILLADGEIAWTSMESAGLTHPIDDLERVIELRVAKNADSEGASTDTLKYGQEVLLWAPERSSTPIPALAGRVNGCPKLLSRHPSVSQGEWALLDPQDVREISTSPIDSTAPPSVYEDVAWTSSTTRESILTQLSSCR